MQNEKVIEIKSCKHCNSNFEITDKDLEFYEKVSPVFQNRKYSIPTPKLCPNCRQQRRLSFRNERKLYHRKCDLSGKQIISTYSPDKLFKVYDQNEWWSDKWEPLNYSKEFDFNRSFFEQFEELMKEVPRVAIANTNSENSNYTNYTANNKDCYLIFSNGYGHNESCYYGTCLIKSNNCVDSINISECDNCFDCVDCNNCYKLFSGNCCDNCNNSYFLDNCRDCSYCISCKGLVNKSYCIQNKQYSKEHYFDILEKSKINTIIGFSVIKSSFNNFSKTVPNIFSRQSNCENCSGDHLLNSQNCIECFDTSDTENSAFIQYAINENSYCYDNSQIGGSSYCYENHSMVGGDHCNFSSVCWWGTNNLFYCDYCFNNTSNCFGCIGLKNKSYCILNKQYTKEEYEILVPKIIEHMISTGEWGEFFPSSISPFGYNETVANEYFPLEKEEILKKGFKYCDYEKQNGYDGEFYIPLEIQEYDEKIVGKEKADKNIESILKGILKCEISGKPFRIIKQELDFYIKHSLPIPKRHQDQRHLDRMKLRNPRKLFDRKCDKCSKEIKSTYSQYREEIVYCEECYNKDVY